MTNSMINRREALRYVAGLMGGALSAPAVLGVLSGCSAKPNASWKPVFLSDAQAAVVTEVAEIIIPRTDTPGAIDVGVPAFIDVMLKDAHAPTDQTRFTSGLAQFEEQAQRQYKGAFLKLEPAQRVAFVQSVHDAAVVEQEKLVLPASRGQRPFVLMMKELTLLGFFTSEVGATQVLQYRQVPGEYRPCIPTAQAGNGKTWAVVHDTPF